MSRRPQLPRRLKLALVAFSVTVFWVISFPNFAHSSVPSPAQTTLSPLASIATADLVQQGRSRYESGRYLEAINALQTALQHYRSQGNQLAQAMTLSNLALAYQQLGQWQNANESIRQSLSLLEQLQGQNHNQSERSQVLAQTWDIQGSLQLDTGQAEAALATWQNSQTLYQQLGDRNGVARSRINQVQALQTLGFYRRALSTLTEVNQLLQEQPNSLTKAIQLRALGDALQLAGDLEQAQQVLQRSLEIAKAVHSPQEVSAALLSLGNLARSRLTAGGVQAAIDYYQQAANLAPTPITKVQAQINWLNLLATLNQAGSVPALVPQIQTALATLPPSQASIYAQIQFAQTLIKSGYSAPGTERPSLPAPDPLSPVPSTTPNNQQVALRGQSQPADNVAVGTRGQGTGNVVIPPPQAIAQILATAVQQAQGLGDQRAEAHAIGALGNLYEQTQQWNYAQNLTQQALLLAQTINATDISYRWQWQLGRLLKQQGDIPGAIAAYDAAVNTLKSLRRDLVAVNRDVQFSFRESVEPVYRESVALLLESTNGAPPSPAKLDLARQRIEALQLAELDNFFREACLDGRVVPLDKVVDQDNPTAAVIYPIILADQLHVIVKIPQQALQHYAVKQSRTEVESVLSQLRQNLTEPDTLNEMQQQARQVYDWLIRPIAAELETSGVNTLVFVLDGAFRNVPMAALYDGNNYLVEKYAVALSLGLQLLSPKPLTDAPLQVLAAGLVEPPSAYRHQFPPLPGIEEEFRLIQAAGIPLQPLLNQAFRTQTLEQKVNTAPFNVVHLATHGQFSSQAKDTFILAADGPINVNELDSLLRSRGQTRADAIELLVLSACQTATGDDRATLGLAGVTIRAGARSTLASLWSISDQSTAILIGEFYRELTTAKVTKAEALRRAQVTLLTQYPNFSRPLYWSPYILVGNWL